MIASSWLFDAGTVGYLLQPGLCGHPVSGFRHWPPCHPLVVATAEQLAGFAGQHLIAPQTILVRGCLEQIAAGLRAAGLPAVHVVLGSDEDILRQRILRSDEARLALAHLSRITGIALMDDLRSHPFAADEGA